MSKKEQKTKSLFDYVEGSHRVFLVDWSVYVHRGIYSWRKNKKIPSTYFTLSSVLADLRKLKPSRKDLIILAIDSYGKGNWRRDYDPAYKANRKEAREKQKDIDWGYHFKQMNNLLENVHRSTQFIPIQIDRLEADDIISYCCRYYKDKNCYILTNDSDMNQLYVLGNVKIFSPNTKRIREVKNPLGGLAKKIEKEATDNLITPVTNEIEYKRRKTIVTLLQLPKEIDESLHNVIKDIKPKKRYNPNKLWYKSLKKRYPKTFID